MRQAKTKVMTTTYPELDELGELVRLLESVGADELELEVLLEEARQHPRDVGGRRLSEHLQTRHCCFDVLELDGMTCTAAIESNVLDDRPAAGVR